jgi:hypothetical protein
VTRDEFEPAVLELWMKSRIPLTKAHLQYHTKAKRRRIEKWLDELVVEGVLDVEVTDEGEMIWTVPGATRPLDGPETFAAYEKLVNLRAEARKRVRSRSKKRKPAEDSADEPIFGSPTTALVRAGKASLDLDKPRKEGEKSLLLSAGLSFFGPLGWLYAGSFKESLPAIAAFLAAGAILPSFLLMPIMWVAMPLSAIAGLVYAWQHNRKGERTTIFLDDGKDDDD